MDISERIDTVEARLTALADAPRTDALTEPDAGGEERWEAAQVWAHIAEFGDYWLDELDALLASSDPQKPFGRVKSNPTRIAAIESGRALPIAEHLATTKRALERLRRSVGALGDDGWARTASHQTLGTLSMEQVMDEFLIGHYEQHAAQLEGLA